MKQSVGDGFGRGRIINYFVRRGVIFRKPNLLSKSFSKEGGVQIYFTNPSVREFSFGGLRGPGGPWERNQIEVLMGGSARELQKASKPYPFG